MLHSCRAHLLRTRLYLWRDTTNAIIQASILHRRQVIRRCFHAWLRLLAIKRATVLASRNVCFRWRYYRQVAAFEHWRRQTQLVAWEAALEARALKFRTRSVFAMFVNAITQSKRRKHYMRRSRRRCCKRAFEAWKCGVAAIQEDSRRCALVRRVVLRHLLVRWHQALRLSTIEARLSAKVCSDPEAGHDAKMTGHLREILCLQSF